MTSLIYSSTILPSGFFYSETDEEDRTVSKLILIFVGYSNLQHFQACVLACCHHHGGTFSNLRLPTPFTYSSHSIYLCFRQYWCLFECDYACECFQQSLQNNDCNSQYVGWFRSLRNYDDDYCRLGNAMLFPPYWSLGLSF